MNYCDVTMATPAQNLACDEVLLDLAEAGLGGPLLRFWEPRQHFVVLGYSNHAAREVNLDFCRQEGIPVFRRCSGGGTVLQGPGCLNYSLILRIEMPGPLAGIHSANQFIMDRQAHALSRALGRKVEQQGDTDLAVGRLKIAGNAQRRRRSFLVFHGCFLLNLDFDLLDKALPMPSKQPDYRQNRSHGDFLLNLQIPAEVLKSSLCAAWEAQEPAAPPPFQAIEKLAREKYLSDEWNFKF